MSDETTRGFSSGPAGEAPKKPTTKTGPAANAGDIAGTAASASVAQGLQSVMAVIGENYDPSVSGAVDKVATSPTATSGSATSKLTDKIDAARLKAPEGSSVTQGLQSIMAVIGENYEDEPENVEISVPDQPPAIEASKSFEAIEAMAKTEPRVTTPPPSPRSTVSTAPQDTRNPVAESAVSELVPLLTADERNIAHSHTQVVSDNMAEERSAAASPAGSSATIAGLLNQLKSDISSLEKDNAGARERFNMPAVIDSASSEVRTLLAELQGDISALRAENETLKQQYNVPTAAVAASQGSEISLLLNQLQGDIANLRSENDALRGRYGVGSAADSGNELSSLLSQLQGDISGLRQESDSFKNYYSNPTARRGGTSIAQAFLMTIGLVALVGGATVGGIYYANSLNDQNNENLMALLGLEKARNEKVAAALEAARIANEKTVVVKPKTVTPKPPVKVAAVAPKTPPALPRVVVRKQPNLDSAEVKALLKDAQNLIDLGDLVSARQMLEYAMSQHSAEAAYRLAQTFDPLYLASIASVLSVEPNITRAKVLYYSAARQGHKAAAKRLAELRRTP